MGLDFNGSLIHIYTTDNSNKIKNMVLVQWNKEETKSQLVIGIEENILEKHNTKKIL
jgi:hypothetical protein